MFRGMIVGLALVAAVGVAETSAQYREPIYVTCDAYGLCYLTDRPFPVSNTSRRSLLDETDLPVGGSSYPTIDESDLPVSSSRRSDILLP